MNERSFHDIIDENGFTNIKKLKEGLLNDQGFNDHQTEKIMEVLPLNNEKININEGDFMLRFVTVATFKDLDRNGNGLIDLSELLKSYEFKNEETAKKLLKFMDLNNDGQISLDEYLKQCQPCNYNQIDKIGAEDYYKK